MSIRPPRAVHLQIADQLREQILDGTLPPGAAVPAESELAALYGVSRVTVNRAVQELRREHLVEVRRGVGTYVAEWSPEERLDEEAAARVRRFLDVLAREVDGDVDNDPAYYAGADYVLRRLRGWLGES